MAKRFSLQYASTLETCSVLLGRSASLLLPAYFPIQSLRCEVLLCDPSSCRQILDQDGMPDLSNKSGGGALSAHSFKGCRASVSVMTLLSPKTSLKKFLSLSSSVPKLALRTAAAVLAHRTECRQNEATLRSHRSSHRAACIVECVFLVIQQSFPTICNALKAHIVHISAACDKERF